MTGPQAVDVVNKDAWHGMSGPSFQADLTSIARVAYGSRSYEKTFGGRGNIALVNGHVVKFNTHIGGGGRITAEMKRGCDALRWELERIARSMLRDSGVSLKEFQDEIASIRAKLGLSADGRTVVAKSLLDRKVVASVIRQIDARTGRDSFCDAPTRSMSTRHRTTGFEAAVRDQRERAFMIRQPADPARPDSDLARAFETLDETVVRGAEREIVNIHADLAYGLAWKILTSGGREKLSEKDAGDLRDFARLQDRVASNYGQVTQLTMDVLKQIFDNPDSAEARTIKSLPEGFRKMAEGCRKYFEASGGKETALAELANAYEARARELDALLEELQAEVALNPAPDVANPAGEVTVATRLARAAVGQGETREMLVGLRDRLADLARDLDEIKRNAANDTSVGDKTTRLKHLEIDLNVAAEAIRNRLADARESMRGPNAAPADLTVLLGLEKEIESMRAAILEIRRPAVEELGVQLVKDHFPVYPDGLRRILSNDIAATVREMVAHGTLEGRAETHVAAIKADLQTKIPTALKNLSDAIRDYLGAKSGLAETVARRALERCAKGLKNLRLTDSTLAYLKRLGSTDKSFSIKMFQNLTDEVYIDRLVDRVQSFRAYLKTDFGARATTDKVLEGLRTGQYGVGTYVGARVWQATADMIDPSLQEGNLVNGERLGSGNYSTTYLCKYRMPDGTNRSYVFKPEHAGRNSVEGMLLMNLDLYRSDQQLAHLNFASAQVAHELGLTGKVPDVRVGSFNGSFGLFMDVAPGTSPKGLMNAEPGSSAEAAKKRLLGFMGFNDDGTVPENGALNAENIGKLAHATTDLEWLDIIIGNNDRHGDNYHVDLRNDGNVSVTGIDNDATFPNWHLGFGKYRLDPERWDLIVKLPIETSLLKPLNTRFAGVSGLKEAVRVENDELIVDINKIDDSTWAGKKARAWLANVIDEIYGYKRVVCPNFISRSTYDNLMRICCGKKQDGMLLKDAHDNPVINRDANGEPELLNDNDLIEYVMVTYGAHLKDTDQVEAMVSRLKDAWNHAQALKAAGRLVERDEDWGSPECYDKIRADWNDESEYHTSHCHGLLNSHILSLGETKEVFKQMTPHERDVAKLTKVGSGTRPVVAPEPYPRARRTSVHVTAVRNIWYDQHGPVGTTFAQKLAQRLADQISLGAKKPVDEKFKELFKNDDDFARLASSLAAPSFFDEAEEVGKAAQGPEAAEKDPRFIGTRPGTAPETDVVFSPIENDSVVMTISRSRVPEGVEDGGELFTKGTNGTVMDGTVDETYSIRLTKIGSFSPLDDNTNLVKVGEHYFRIEVDPVASRIDATFGQGDRFSGE